MAEYWFKPKQRGIGAGVPIHWKGWALYVALVAAILAVPSALELYFGYLPSPLIRLAGVVAISLPFLWVSKQKTEGGWRWRRGEESNDEYGA